MISIVLPPWKQSEAALAGLASLVAHNAVAEIVVAGNSGPLPDAPGIEVRHGAPRGDLIVATAADVLHTQPVLDQLAARLAVLDDTACLMAAAWCPEEKRWHCHSAMAAPIAVCALMRKELWERCGEYDGLTRRLVAAGARLFICDDLIVTSRARRERAA